MKHTHVCFHPSRMHGHSEYALLLQIYTQRFCGVVQSSFGQAIMVEGTISVQRHRSQDGTHINDDCTLNAKRCRLVGLRCLFQQGYKSFRKHQGCNIVDGEDIHKFRNFESFQSHEGRPRADPGAVKQDIKPRVLHLFLDLCHDIRILFELLHVNLQNVNILVRCCDASQFLK